MAIVALAGGVGGAKLLAGLARLPEAEQLVAVVNTGDDFEHLGLRISPDVDTVMYTLAGLANPETGWGLASETWNFLAMAGRLGIETWFRLGDQDIATHLERTRRLQAGERLSDITQHFCSQLGVRVPVVPMTDDPVRTIVHTATGPLPFQEYFVQRRCEPAVLGFEFLGITSAQPAPEFLEALAQAEVVIYCPSNPYVSIAPILGLPGVKPILAGRRQAGALIVAVSPIVGGSALKGPAAKMMRELGLESTVTALAEHYAGQIDGLVIDQVDGDAAARIRDMGMAVMVTDTIMRNDEQRQLLARQVLDFALGLASAHGVQHSV